jgi:spermidine synthase
VRFVREHNPDRASDDPRVTTYVDDGRGSCSGLTRSNDLILFALPDSLSLVSGASALRLESYLFTEEAIRSAREHLGPGGAFSMYNYYCEQWLVDRLGNTLTGTFGHSPCLLSSPHAIS